MTSIDGTRLRFLRWLVTGSLFMEVLDGNIIATALPEMAKSFGVEVLRLNVAMSAYLLALGVFIPVSGWFSQRFGTRKTFAMAIAGFTLTSLACGLVPHLTSFIGLRILQGACGALMVPVGRLLVLRHTPPEGRMQAMSNLVWPALIAPVIAPPLGGLITTHASWHWIFFINVPLGLVAFVLALRLIPSIDTEEKRPFDWLGFALCGPGVFALLSGLDMLAAMNLLGLLPLCVGVLLVVLAIRHFGRANSPMLELSAMRIATFRVSVLSGSVSRMAISSLPFLLPLMLQVGLGMSAVHAGSWVLVLFLGNVSMKAITTPILRRFGYRQVMLVNGILAAISMAACALISNDMQPVVMFALLLVCGMTRSMQFTSLSTLAFSEVQPRQLSDANGLFNVVSQVSQSAGITLAVICVQLGAGAAAWSALQVPAANFKVALLLVSMVSLWGLREILKLPSDAGDRFVGRS